MGLNSAGPPMSKVVSKVACGEELRLPGKVPLLYSGGRYWL